MATMRYDRVRTLIPPTAHSILEIGCGQGALGYRLATDRPGRSYLGLEPDAESCAVARQRLSGVEGADVRCASSDGLNASETFDLACAFEVLEHTADDHSTLAAWLRHVRPGGHVLISVPAHPGRFGLADEVAGHYRRYDPSGLRELFRDVGLDDIRIVLYGMPLGYLLERVRGPLLARAAKVDDESPEERTRGSGRLLQPSGAVSGTLIAVGTAPFRILQRAFPHHGIAIVARGQVRTA
jgi:SAM-dependent methyltransferase